MTSIDGADAYSSLWIISEMYIWKIIVNFFDIRMTSPRIQIMWSIEERTMLFRTWVLSCQISIFLCPDHEIWHEETSL